MLNVFGLLEGKVDIYAILDSLVHISDISDISDKDIGDVLVIFWEYSRYITYFEDILY